MDRTTKGRFARTYIICNHLFFLSKARDPKDWNLLFKIVHSGSIKVKLSLFRLFNFLEERFRRRVFDPGWLNERNASVMLKSRLIKSYFISITSENLSTKLKILIVYRNLGLLTMAALVRISKCHIDLTTRQ